MENTVMNAKKRMGRPPKYASVLKWLDKDRLYSAGAIARIYAAHNPGTTKLEQMRIRITLGRLKVKHSFPKRGDGLITLPRTMPAPAWFGWRWIQAYGGEVVGDACGTEGPPVESQRYPTSIVYTVFPVDLAP